MAKALTYLLPTCGRAEYLKWALRSLEVQTAPWKIIGFDNGSKDGSGQLLEDFCTAHGGRFLRSPKYIDDGGWASAHALFEAWGGDGPAAMLHDDDMCHPLRTARLLECQGSNDLLVTGMWTFAAGQEETALAGEPTTDTVWACDPGKWGEGLHAVVGNTTTPTALLTGRILALLGGLGEYKSGAQDTLLWFRAALAGLEIGYIPEPLYYYRLHPQQSSQTFYVRVPEFDDEVARLYAQASREAGVRA